jgi:hypothetical protein
MLIQNMKFQGGMLRRNNPTNKDTKSEISYPYRFFDRVENRAFTRPAFSLKS